MRSNVVDIVPRLPRLAQLRAAFDRSNKAAGIAIAVLACLVWAQYVRPQ